MVLAVAGTASAGFETPVTPDPKDPTFSGTGFYWNATVRTFAGYSSNVQYFNDYLLPGPVTGGLSGGATFSFDATKRLSEGYTLQSSFRLDGVGYTGGDNPDYAHVSLQSAVTLRHDHTLASGAKASLAGTYSFRKTKAQDWDGLDTTAHQFIVRGDVNPRGPWSFFGDVTIAIADYGIFAGDPDSNRDGIFSAIGVGAAREMDGIYLTKLSGKVQLERNSADGDNWSYSGVAVQGAADFDLPGPFAARLNASHAKRSYVGDFTSQGFSVGRDSQNVTSVGGQLIWYLAPGRTADISVKHQVVDSNSPEFTGRETSVTAGVTVRLR